MYIFNPIRDKELECDIKDIFTNEEKELIYQALSFTADELSLSHKRFENLLKPSNELTSKAGQLYIMAQVFKNSIEQEK